MNTHDPLPQDSPTNFKSRAKEVWFMVSTWSMVIVLVILSPALFSVLGWFTEAYRDAAAASEVSHRLHEVVFGVFFSLALAAAVALLTRLRSPGALFQLAIPLVALTVMVGLTMGPDPGLLIYLLPLGAVIATHGSIRPIRETGRQWWAILLVLLFAPVMLDDTSAHISRAIAAAQNHTSHWSVMAAFTTTLLILGLAVAAGVRGFRFVSWSLAVASVTYGAASLKFPYDASSHRPAYSIALIMWGVAWGLGARFAAGTRSPKRRRLVRVAVAAALAPVLMVSVIIVASLDTPPNVPHRPDPSRPEVLAAEVDRGTCVGCHATGSAGAPQPPHDLSDTCGDEGCWGGRTDCAGCHRIDPDLGGPTELVHLDNPHVGHGLRAFTGGEALDQASIGALRRMGSDP